MHFIDIFIKRPVLSTVISLLILAAGIGTALTLQVRQYPYMNNATIIVTTAYPGANPSIIQGFITTPLEQSVGSADGIDYMTSTSTLGLSTLTINVKLGSDPNNVLSQVVQKVNAVQNQMPQGAQSPSIEMQSGNSFPSLILSFTSNALNEQEITAYIKNQLTPKLQSLGGISNVIIWGEKNYAMRIWLNYDNMARFNVTPDDIANALQVNSLIAAGGQIKGPYFNFTLNPTTNLDSAQAYEQLVVKNENGNLVRIGNVANVELGAQTYTSNVSFNGKYGVFAGVVTASDANVLTVVDNIMKNLSTIETSLPAGLNMNIVYDNTTYIKASIHDVVKTLIEAIVIVTIVLFLFIGSIRSVIIPVAAIPLSMIGAFLFMFLMGFSINLLTLLSMVLAIGLVVDDAIVVLENIYRHIEEGATPFEAAIQGAREIANPVILMTLTLVAVYLPIGMMGGLTGILFTEFAYSLAGAVVISGIVAYTFSPMLCSKVLSKSITETKTVKFIDSTFEKLKNAYEKALRTVMSVRIVIILFGAVVVISCYFLFSGTKSELAPTEDQAFIGIQGTAPSPANIHYLDTFSPALYKDMQSLTGVQSTFVVNGYPQSNSSFGGVVLKPWNERKETQMELKSILQNLTNNVAGSQIYTFEMPSLPGVSFGPPMQFVIQSINSYPSIYDIANNIIKKMMTSGLFVFAQSDLQFDNPQMVINIDREKAASLGISMQKIAQALGYAYSGGYVNYFSMLGYSYQVIPELANDMKLTKEQLGQIRIATASGKLIPLSSIVTFETQSMPLSLNRFQQLNSATINAVTTPGISQGQAIEYMQNLAKNELPQGYTHDYAGSVRQYLGNTNQMAIAFLFALIVIFLMLAAQFESFRDPFIILISVPMSICGALIPLYLGQIFNLGYASINIYTQVGLITLIGLISKHGILLVEFANKLQEEGYNKVEAILKSAALRLRPILMTTAAMVVGVVPLVIATGAGAVSRQSIGIVIASGMTIGTMFTLFVVPVVYSYLAKDRRALIARWKEEEKIIAQINKSHPLE
ncbi:efflux RND transporter permease subunit [Fastidiosibacter lacustris]|uniref:efflux RND transporter permease subunit n=1 Tax=Fastidiosibacter lacustris TaxID=2056695 RepID=UPI000E340AD7|nr:efflux RND transporter permease subunit [Fastidiosibacter lacustris]